MSTLVDSAVAVRVPGFLAGGGELGRLIARRDWSRCPLGPIERWPDCLRTTLGFMLRSPAPMAMMWGDDGVMLYNDAYAAFAGGRHPELLGSKVREGWPEIADFSDNAMRTVLAGGTLACRDQALTLYRNGMAERVRVNLDYSPVLDDAGEPVAVLCILAETTEHVEAREALLASEDHYRHALELDPQTSWTSSPDGQLDHVSGRWMEWTGTTGLGSTWADGLHPDDRTRTFEVWGHSVATGEPYDIEHRVKMRDGSFRWMHSRGYPRRDEAGRIVKWYGSTEDVHDRKTAEERLRASEERVRRIIDEATDFIFTATLDQRITSCNPAIARALGYTPDEIVGRSISDFLDADGAAQSTAMIDEKLRTGGATRHEIAVQSRSGERMIWEINSRLSRGPDGAPGGVHVIARDVTEQRAAQVALAESEERLRLVQATGGIASFDWDIRAGIVIRSPEYYALYGLPQPPPGEDLDTSVWISCVHPDDRPQVSRWFAEHRTTRGSFDREYRIVKRDTGELRWLHVRGRVITDDNDVAVRMVVALTDVTDRRENDARLQALTDGVPAFVWFATPDGELRYFNQRWYDYTGQTPEEALPNGWTDTLHPDDAERTAALWADARAREVDYEVEVRYRRHDGEYRWHVARAQPMHDGDGRVIAWAGFSTDIHEARELAAALSASEARLSAVLESVNECFYAVDRDWRFIVFNRACEEHFGVPRERILGQAVWDMFPQGEHSAYGEACRRAMYDGIATRFEASSIVRPDRVVDTRVAPMANGIAVAITDITARKAAERRLHDAFALAEREAAERAAILGQLAEGVIVADPDGRIMFVNEAASRLHGVDDVGVPPERYSETYHLFTLDGEPYPSGELPLARAVSNGETVVDARWRIRRPDGTDVLAIGSARPISGPDGSPIGAVLTLRDDTDRNRAEEALRRLNDTLEEQVAERTAERDRMWRSSLDLLLVINLDGTIGAINPAVGALDYTPEELVGQHFGSYVHPDDAAAVADAILRATRAPVSDFETRLRAKGGAWRVFSWTATPSEGSVYAVGRDVTDDKMREAELAAAQEALRQSQKMEAIGQLTGGVAHDFNNLLTPIIGSLDILQRRASGDARTERLVDGALQSAERAKTLVQRLLAFARRQPLQPTTIDVGALVGGMRELVGSTLGPRIRLQIDVADAIPPALADLNQLEMALLNLAVNARDAMPDGGTLSVAAASETVDAGHRSRLAPGLYVRLSVTDTGTGMDEGTLARAIEPFFSTKGIGKGTGLGLSMVHGLAAQLGGALTLSSRLGVGTNAELWLPVAPIVEAERLPTDTYDSATPGSGVALVVDDEALVRASTAEMLVEMGYDVVEASSANEALSALAARRFDLLVTDHLMPGMTGAELAGTVRARFPDLPILIVSGYADVDAIAPDLPRLSKPFRRTDLAAALGELAGA